MKPVSEESDATRQALAAMSRFFSAHPYYRFDTNTYTPDEWASRREKYGNGSVLTVTVDSPLGHLLNGYAAHPQALQDLDCELTKEGLYYELGFAWSMHIYPIAPQETA